MDIAAHEQRLIDELTLRWKEFTSFPDYFQLRGLEFRALRTLLSDLFVPGKYRQGLEIGCGFGFQTALLRPFVDELLAVDIPVEDHDYSPGSGTALDAAKRLINRDLGLDVRFEHAWPDQLPIEASAVDFLYTSYVLEHIPNLDSAMTEWSRVVTPGGVMIHVVPSMDALTTVYMLDNTKPPWRSMFGGLVRRNPRRPRLGLTGNVTPALHSEFARSFVEQLNTYSLENFLFPAISHGFAVEEITRTRSSNHVVVLRKL